MLAQAHTDEWIVHLLELTHLLFLTHWLVLLKSNKNYQKLFKLAQLFALAWVFFISISFYPLCTISSKEISRPSVAGWKSAWCLYISEDYSAQKGGRKCGCMHVLIFSVNPFLIGLLLSSVLPAPLWVSEHFHFSSGSWVLEVVISLLFCV